MSPTARDIRVLSNRPAGKVRRIEYLTNCHGGATAGASRGEQSCGGRRICPPGAAQRKTETAVTVRAWPHSGKGSRTAVQTPERNPKLSSVSATSERLTQRPGSELVAVHPGVFFHSDCVRRTRLIEQSTLDDARGRYVR
jgi:hypothetical protein